jgi:hypothetical protein
LASVEIWTTVGLRPKEIDFMLDNDLDEAEATARTLFPTFDSLSEARKAVLVNMAFNMGLHRLAGFVFGFEFGSSKGSERNAQAVSDMLKNQ